MSGGAAMNPSGDAQPSGAPPRPAPQPPAGARGAPGAQGRPSFARDRAIVAARAQGDTLAQIGACFGLTRERVRQILVAHGGDDTQTAACQRARAERQWAAAMECRDELLALFRAGLGDTAIAQRLGVKRETVGAVIVACAHTDDKDARRRAQLPSSATIHNRLGRWAAIHHHRQERGEQDVERPGLGGGGACVSS